MKTQIKNGLLLLEREGRYVTEQGDLFLTDDTITAVGTAPEQFQADKVIDGTDKLIIPGLQNCHTHTYMSVFRNMADDIAFDEWLFRRILPLEDKLTGEAAYWGAMLACVEMLKTGTTSFLDMHMFPGKTAQAAIDTGIRGVISRGLVGEGRNDTAGQNRIQEALTEMEQFQGHPNLSFMLGPHAIYTCATEYLELVLETAKQHNVPLHIHLSETRHEVEECLKQHGKTPVAYLNDMGFFDVHTVAAHCVHVTEADCQIFAEKNVFVAGNPKSNMKLGNGFAPVAQMLRQGVNFCLGTDSAASNNALNLFSEMNFTALIHKGTGENAQDVSAQEVLRMVTQTGAKALGLNCGAIAPGKLADLVLLDLNRPQFCPRHDLTASLSYSANGSEVDTVLVGGSVVVEQGRMVNVDEMEIYRKAQEAIDSIQ
jgi:5-methylthioadenosine/S-adenosylhomocysteine deaminase